MRHFVLLLAGLPLVLQAQRSEHELRGSHVAIYNLVGELKVVPASGSSVRVGVTRRGADAGGLKVESGEVDGKPSLRVIYPEDRIVYRGDARSGDHSRTQLSVRSDGTFGGNWGGSRRGRRVEITSSGRGAEAWADMTVEVPANQRIELHLGVGVAEVENVSGDISVDVHAASLKVRGTKGRLVLDTGSGDISVTNVEGDAYLDTGSGFVAVDGVRGRVLKLDSGSGGLRVLNVTTEELSLDSGSGRVELRGVQARDVSVDTGSGGVEIELLSDVDDLRVDTGSGGITLAVPSSLGAEVSIESGSGGIDLEVPLTVRSNRRGRLQGSLGDGRGRIQIETGSGGVRLRRAGARELPRDAR
jgi:hypothetical protein